MKTLLSRLSIVVILLLHVTLVRAGEPAAPWPKAALASPREVTLAGPLGEALQRGVARLAQPPYTEPWLRADVSFELQRTFTNYSGDVSGRFLELASLTSPAGQFSPATLAPLIKTIGRYQKADGHFGGRSILASRCRAARLPFPCSGATRGCWWDCVTAAQESTTTELLAAARRLGDFYVNTTD